MDSLLKALKAAAAAEAGGQPAPLLEQSHAASADPATKHGFKSLVNKVQCSVQLVSAFGRQRRLLLKKVNNRERQSFGLTWEFRHILSKDPETREAAELEMLEQQAAALPYFAALPSLVRQELLRFAELASFGADSSIFTVGEEAHLLHVLLSGAVLMPNGVPAQGDKAKANAPPDLKAARSRLHRSESRKSRKGSLRKIGLQVKRTSNKWKRVAGTVKKEPSDKWLKTISAMKSEEKEAEDESRDLILLEGQVLCEDSTTHSMPFTLEARTLEPCEVIVVPAAHALRAFSYAAVPPNISKVDDVVLEPAILSLDAPLTLTLRQLLRIPPTQRAPADVERLMGILHALVLCQHMTAAALKSVAEHSLYIRLTDDEVLFEHGDYADFVYILLAGSVLIEGTPVLAASKAPAEEVASPKGVRMRMQSIMGDLGSTFSVKMLQDVNAPETDARSSTSGELPPGKHARSARASTLARKAFGSIFGGQERGADGGLARCASSAAGFPVLAGANGALFAAEALNKTDMGTERDSTVIGQGECELLAIDRWRLADALHRGRPMGKLSSEASVLLRLVLMKRGDTRNASEQSWLIEMLDSLPHLDEFDRPLQASLAEAAQYERMPANTVLFARENKRQKLAYYLLSGQVACKALSLPAARTKANAKGGRGDKQAPQFRKDLVLAAGVVLLNDTVQPDGKEHKVELQCTEDSEFLALPADQYLRAVQLTQPCLGHNTRGSALLRSIFRTAPSKRSITSLEKAAALLSKVYLLSSLSLAEAVAVLRSAEYRVADQEGIHPFHTTWRMVPALGDISVSRGLLLQPGSPKQPSGSQSQSKSSDIHAELYIVLSGMICEGTGQHELAHPAGGVFNDRHLLQKKQISISDARCARWTEVLAVGEAVYRQQVEPVHAIMMEQRLLRLSALGVCDQIHMQIHHYSDAHFWRLLSDCCEQRYSNGSLLLEQGTISGHLYMIEEGTASLVHSRTTETGVDTLVVTTICKGDYFGDVSVFLKAVEPLSVVANVAVELVAVPGPALLQAMTRENITKFAGQAATRRSRYLQMQTTSTNVMSTMRRPGNVLLNKTLRPGILAGTQGRISSSMDGSHLTTIRRGSQPLGLFAAVGDMLHTLEHGGNKGARPAHQKPADVPSPQAEDAELDANDDRAVADVFDGAPPLEEATSPAGSGSLSPNTASRRIAHCLSFAVPCTGSAADLPNVQSPMNKPLLRFDTETKHTLLQHLANLDIPAGEGPSTSSPAGGSHVGRHLSRHLSHNGEFAAHPAGPTSPTTAPTHRPHTAPGLSNAPSNLAGDLAMVNRFALVAVTAAKMHLLSPTSQQRRSSSSSSGRVSGQGSPPSQQSCRQSWEGEPGWSSSRSNRPASARTKSSLTPVWEGGAVTHVGSGLGMQTLAQRYMLAPRHPCPTDRLETAASGRQHTGSPESCASDSGMQSEYYDADHTEAGIDAPGGRVHRLVDESRPASDRNGHRQWDDAVTLNPRDPGGRPGAPRRPPLPAPAASPGPRSRHSPAVGVRGHSTTSSAGARPVLPMHQGQQQPTAASRQVEAAIQRAYAALQQTGLSRGARHWEPDCSWDFLELDSDNEQADGSGSESSVDSLNATREPAGSRPSTASSCCALIQVNSHAGTSDRASSLLHIHSLQSPSGQGFPETQPAVISGVHVNQHDICAPKTWQTTIKSGKLCRGQALQCFKAVASRPTSPDGHGMGTGDSCCAEGSPHQQRSIDETQHSQQEPQQGERIAFLNAGSHLMDTTGSTHISLEGSHMVTSTCTTHGRLYIGNARSSRPSHSSQSYSESGRQSTLHLARSHQCGAASIGLHAMDLPRRPVTRRPASAPVQPQGYLEQEQHPEHVEPCNFPCDLGHQPSLSRPQAGTPAMTAVEPSETPTGLPTLSSIPAGQTSFHLQNQSSHSVWRGVSLPCSADRHSAPEQQLPAQLRSASLPTIATCDREQSQPGDFSSHRSRASGDGQASWIDQDQNAPVRGRVLPGAQHMQRPASPPRRDPKSSLSSSQRTQQQQAHNEAMKQTSCWKHARTASAPQPQLALRPVSPALVTIDLHNNMPSMPQHNASADTKQATVAGFKGIQQSSRMAACTTTIPVKPGLQVHNIDPDAAIAAATAAFIKTRTLRGDRRPASAPPRKPFVPAQPVEAKSRLVSHKVHDPAHRAQRLASAAAGRPLGLLPVRHHSIVMPTIRHIMPQTTDPQQA